MRVSGRLGTIWWECSLRDTRCTSVGTSCEDGSRRLTNRAYLGHAARDVTDLYERHEVTAFVEEDAGRLRELLGRTGRAVEAIS